MRVRACSTASHKDINSAKCRSSLLCSEDVCRTHALGPPSSTNRSCSSSAATCAGRMSQNVISEANRGKQLCMQDDIMTGSTNAIYSN
eukprot:5670884-Amphidinium_carterae.3